MNTGPKSCLIKSSGQKDRGILKIKKQDGKTFKLGGITEIRN